MASYLTFTIQRQRRYLASYDDINKYPYIAQNPIFVKLLVLCLQTDSPEKS